MGFFQQFFCKHNFGEEAEGWYKVKIKKDGHPAYMETLHDLGGKGTTGYLSCVKCSFSAPFCKPTD